MFVWSSSASPVSEGGIHVFRGEYGNGLNGVPHAKGIHVDTLVDVLLLTFFSL